MKPIRRILVGVKDPKARRLPALEKAARLAQATGAELALFHAIDVPVAAEPYLYAEGGFRQFERGIRAGHVRDLERLAARLRRRKLKLRVDADWDHPIHEAIVRHAARIKADLIVAEAHAGRRLAPWILHLTDWELLRTSPKPVLIVKSARAWSRPKLLAAIDPAHTFAKPAGLDGVILAAADRLGDALGGNVHVMHAYSQLPRVAGPFSGASPEVIAESLVELDRVAAKTFADALRRSKIPARQRHLVQGAPADAIPRLAKKLKADFVVMGAVSRSALKRVVIGNTAERILGALDCDVLVVKPARFVTRVSRRKRGVRYLVSSEVSMTY